MKFVGERRALAAVAFAFYFLVYMVMAMGGQIPKELAPAFYALAGVYGLAFFALVAGYFWARWYAIGVGLYGVITGAVGMWQMGPEPIIVFLGGTHLIAVLSLWGASMASSYDGQTAWREKLHMDEHAVQRLGRSVIRAGVSLPLVLLYALAPKPPAQFALGIGALALLAFGMRALVKARAWGILAVGTAGTLMVCAAVAHFTLPAGLAGGMLLSAAAPFAGTVVRFLRG